MAAILAATPAWVGSLVSSYTSVLMVNQTLPQSIH